MAITDRGIDHFEASDGIIDIACLQTDLNSLSHTPTARVPGLGRQKLEVEALLSGIFQWLPREYHLASQVVKMNGLRVFWSEGMS